MTWVKGKSGNPGGRKKLPADVQKTLRAGVSVAAGRLVELCASSDERVAVRAVQVLLERCNVKLAVEGAPGVTVQQVEQVMARAALEGDVKAAAMWLGANDPVRWGGKVADTGDGEEAVDLVDFVPMVKPDG